MSSESAESEFTIINQLGLHARAAAQLVQLANRCKCDVTLKTDSESVNGKSIMGVLMLAAAQGQVLTVSAGRGRERRTASGRSASSSPTASGRPSEGGPVSTQAISLKLPGHRAQPGHGGGACLRARPPAGAGPPR
jgi:phosphocarrier protein